jgi:hypothetical protein
MTQEEQKAMFDAPMSSKELTSASEVFDQYENLDRVSAWTHLKKRACDTSRPFRAYDCAHVVASALVQGRIPYAE